MSSDKWQKFKETEFELHAAALRYGSSISHVSGWDEAERLQAAEDLRTTAAAYRSAATDVWLDAS